MTKKAPILIFGSTGQVGSNVIDLCKERNIDYQELSVDFTNKQQLVNELEALEYVPSAVINAAAYTAVDLAEDERGRAFAINSEAVAILADYCYKNQVLLVHYSTDYVYDGQGNQPFLEDSKAVPLNIYGKSKLAGDMAIEQRCNDYLIFRTSWVYNHEGKNFVQTMLRLFGEKQELGIVNDQVGAPTYAYDIADYSLKAIAAYEKGKHGVYHLANNGEMSWCEFARKIHDLTSNANYVVKNIKPITSAEFPMKATRPKNSRLSGLKLQQVFGLEMPSVENALMRCLARKK